MRPQTEEHRQEVAFELGRGLILIAGPIFVLLIVAAALGNDYNLRWKHLLVIASVCAAAAAVPIGLWALWRSRRKD